MNVKITFSYHECYQNLVHCKCDANQRRTGNFKMTVSSQRHIKWLQQAASSANVTGLCLCLHRVHSIYVNTPFATCVSHTSKFCTNTQPVFSQSRTYLIVSERNYARTRLLTSQSRRRHIGEVGSRASDWKSQIRHGSSLVDCWCRVCRHEAEHRHRASRTQNRDGRVSTLHAAARTRRYSFAVRNNYISIS